MNRAIKQPYYKVLYFIPLFFISSAIYAQDITIELGPNKIGINQAFTIKLVAKNSSIKSYDKFPDIQGFQKRGTSSSSSTNIVNGRVSSSHSIIMTYTALNQGVFTIPAFSIEINGRKVNANGKQVTVGPEVKQQRRNPFFSDPFEDFFGRRKSQPQEFVDIKVDAFLALTTDKKRVYVGEGFTTSLAFYVATGKPAPLQFHDIGNQLGEILKKIKPENCWEENFNIEKINQRNVEINGKEYTQYKVYQATFYPLNNEDIVLPSVGLEMLKYKVAKNPSFFGQSRQEDYKTYYSKEVKVEVNDLPDHPLKDQVAVGHFKLNERLNKNQLKTGESFNYEFNIYGEGNVASVMPPIVAQRKDFDFYDPNVQQNINRTGAKVTGAKSYSYYGIPNEPGEYKLEDYFQWVFFNIHTNDYDTLKATASLKVTGESKKNESIIANDMGSFYDLIDLEDNLLIKQTDYATTKILANILILIVFGTSAYVVLKK